MEFGELVKKTRKLKQAYAVLNRTEGYKTWGLQEHLQAFVGDVGDLQKLVLAKRGFSFSEKDTDQKLARELSDCLWAIITIADELEIDIEEQYLLTLENLENKISDRKVIKPKNKRI